MKTMRKGAIVKYCGSRKDFTVVWTNGTKTKERNFAEFCDIQGIA